MPQYFGYGITFPVATAADIKASSIAFPVIGFALIVLRAFSHRLGNTKPGAADVLAVLAWITLTISGAILAWSAYQGSMGHPTPPDNVLTENRIGYYQKNLLLAEYQFIWLDTLCLGLTKLSILAYFRKLFLSSRRSTWGYATLALMAVVVLWTIAFVLANIFICGSHPAADWGPIGAANKYCLSVVPAQSQLDNAWGISDLILDIFCLALPFPMIWNTQIATKFKISITGVFLVGLMTIIACALKVTVFIQVDNTPVDAPIDENLAVALALQWAMIETGLAFIASQLPTLGLYLTRTVANRVAAPLQSFIPLITMKPETRGGASQSFPADEPGNGPGKDHDAISSSTRDVEADSRV